MRKYPVVRKFLQKKGTDSDAYICITPFNNARGSGDIKIADCNRSINLWVDVAQPETLKKFDTLIDELTKYREYLRKLEPSKE